MKTLILTIVFCCIYLINFSQIVPIPGTPVFDAANAQLNSSIITLITSSNAQVIEEVTQGAQTLAFTEQMLEHAKELDKYYKTVNKAIGNGNQVIKMIKTQAKIIQLYEKYGVKFEFKEKDVVNNLIAKEKKTIKKNYEAIVKSGSKDIEMLNKIIISGSFKMSDYERLQEVNRLKTAMNERLSEMKTFTKKIEAALNIKKRKEEIRTFNSRIL